jgi:2-oxoglutarate ferredoxin oxidoreductase subunit delta
MFHESADSFTCDSSKFKEIRLCIFKNENQGVLAVESQKKFKIDIKKEWCKACEICVSLCPKSVLGKDADGKAEAVQPEKCIGCELCELRCPDFAIRVGRIYDGKTI